MIKNLLFDMGGVLFRQDTDEAFRRFRHHGIDTDYYMGAYGQKDFFLDLETGDITAEEFCQKMAATIGRENFSWEEAQHCWLGFLKDVPVERLRFLETLRNDYHLCLASNTNPFMMAYTRSAQFSTDGKPITDYFDTLFCSYEMKKYKPNADFFTHILQTDHLKADETLFIDDSAKNIKAAEAVDIHGFLVAPNEDWCDRLSEQLATNA